jgi:hypothetical protein
MLGLSIPEVAERARSARDPAAAALIARMTGAPSEARAGLIDALVRALKAAGVWGKLDMLHVLAAHDEQAARRNWVADAYNLAAVNAPGFVADRGFTGDGTTAYLDTGFQPGVSAGAHARQDDNHLGLWCRNNVSGTGIDIGSTNHSINANNAGNLSTRDMAVTTNTVGAGTSIGHSLVSRGGSTGYSRYKNGASLGDATQASAAAIALNLFVGCRNAGGVAGGFSARQIAVAHAGAALSAGEAAALYAALGVYLTAVGAA